MSQPLPPNVHVSSHPCLRTKLSQLRASTANARETKALVHEISLIVGCEATAAGLATKQGPTVLLTPRPDTPHSSMLICSISKSKTHLGYKYTTTDISPESISIVPILRSGLGMLEGDSNFNPPSSIFQPTKILLVHLANLGTSNSYPPSKLSSSSPSRSLPRTRDPRACRILQQPSLPPPRSQHPFRQSQLLRVRISLPTRPRHRNWWHMRSSHPNIERMGR